MAAAATAIASRRSRSHLGRRCGRVEGAGDLIDAIDGEASPPSVFTEGVFVIGEVDAEQVVSGGRSARTPPAPRCRHGRRSARPAVLPIPASPPTKTTRPWPGTSPQANAASSRSSWPSRSRTSTTGSVVTPTRASAGSNCGGRLPRQAEDPLGDDVALHLLGTATDRQRPGEQESGVPLGAVEPRCRRRR